MTTDLPATVLKCFDRMDAIIADARAKKIDRRELRRQLDRIAEHMLTLDPRDTEG